MNALRRILKPISGIVIVAQLALALQPLSAVAKTPADMQAEAMQALREQAKRNPLLARRLGMVQPESIGAQTPTVDAQQTRLIKIAHLLRHLQPEASAKVLSAGAAGSPAGKRVAAIGPKMHVEVETHPAASVLKARQAQMAELRQTLKAEEGAQANTLAEFARTREELVAKHLPAEILARHDAAAAQAQARSQEFLSLSERVLKAPTPEQGDTATAALARFVAQFPVERPHTYSDPKNLPFRAASPKVREPFTSRFGFSSTRLLQPRAVQVASAGSLSGINLPTFAVSPTPTDADLAETSDAQQTPAIQAQAAVLGNDPVKIYAWVRNNVEYLPSYGSIQGADYTLKAKRGNAFDTASLLVALLRAAKVPARYVYGTIEVPASLVMNWVGGVTVPQAALDLLGQGGVPCVGITSGGTIKTIRLEHVWVSAYVDYVPSRGAKNFAPNTWVPLDASFKQYQYTQGMDIKNAVPFDATALATQMQTGATINTAEGWVQNLNTAALQSAMTDYQNKVSSYLAASAPNATVGDLLGTKKTILRDDKILLGTLPYKTVVEATRFAELPDALRWKFRTTFYANPTGVSGDASGDELVSISQTTATLAGQKITFSASPATQADADLFNSYLPKPHADGTPIQPSELPTSLPGYLLKLKPELRVGGKLVSQSVGAVSMGSSLTQTTAFFNPGTQQWEEGEPNAPIAGEYHAIGLDLQGVAKDQLSKLQTTIQATLNKLQQFQTNSDHASSMEYPEKEDISGDMLYAGILGYFANVDIAAQLAARSKGNVVTYRLPSYGAFEISAQSHFFWGVVQRVSFPGMVMDIDRLFYQACSTNADSFTRLDYLKFVGSMGSLFENSVPEKLFFYPPSTSDSGRPQGVSAVKALSLAGKQAQKVYTFSGGNSEGLEKIDVDEDVRAEIYNAISNGMQVTVHETPVDVGNWTGTGYAIVDPDSGSGAYKISGGANGGFLNFVDNNSGLIGLAAWGLVALGGPWVWLAVAIVWAVVAAGLIHFLDQSDGTCGDASVALYSVVAISSAIAGFYVNQLVSFVFWMVGFQFDMGIRVPLGHCGPPLI